MSSTSLGKNIITNIMPGTQHPPTPSPLFQYLDCALGPLSGPSSFLIDLLPRTSCLHLNNLYTTPLESIYTCRFKRHLYHVLFLDKYFISLKKNIWKLNFNVFVKSTVVNLDIWKSKMFEKKWIFKRWYSILLSFITVKHLSAQNFQIFNILK